ncbi:hypothetical protein [Dokdonia sinensis]|nr:hypothetical protein [Dokdonia sinensis]
MISLSRNDKITQPPLIVLMFSLNIRETDIPSILVIFSFYAFAKA